MSKWQSIKTAPKDGTYLLLWINDEHPIVGYWRSDYPAITGWSACDYEHDGCGCCEGPMPKPTHWMPLPEQPSCPKCEVEKSDRATIQTTEGRPK